MTFKILTITAALGLVASGAVAQTNDWLGTTVSYSADDYRASYADARRAAYDNGYRDGVKRGEQAARDRRAFQVERERDYRDADNGYNREFGDRTRYCNDYRGGFAEGYRDGYQRDGRQARGSGYGDAGYGAFQNGTADGYRKGLDDLKDRKSPDPRRQNWYRSADHGYDKSYGSKDAYKDDYRRGFLQGYERAFGERRSGF
jgi:hypothetical protein